MCRWDYISSKKEEALKWISDMIGAKAEILPTYSATEFYSCGDKIYSLRYNKKQKTYEVKERKLMQGKYLTFYHGSTGTAISVNNKDCDFKVCVKWLHIYQGSFESLVKRLMKNGVFYEEAQDYAQDAFLKINDIDAKNSSAFYNIWFKRAFYDWLHDCSLKATTQRNCKIDDIHGLKDYDSKEYEVNFSEFLNNNRQANIVNMMLQGYSITDIAELTHQTWDAVFSVKQRAFKKLKQKLSIDYENK